MKTIYKIMIAFLAISLMIGIASANTPAPSGGAIEHTYEKGILTILIDQIQKPESQEALKAWNYEDIEITAGFAPLNFDYEVSMPAPVAASVPDSLTIPMPFDTTRLQNAFAPKAWDYVDIEIT